MRHYGRAIAAMEWLLIAPAAVFMAALVVRSLTWPGGQAAGAAQQVVMWYAGRMWTLWVLLFALPLAARLTGGMVLLAGWTERAAPPTGWPLSAAGTPAHLAALFTAAATLAAGVILVILALHVLAN